MAGNASTSGTQAVDRAALLVSTVVRADRPLAFSGLVEETSLPRSTVSRLLTAMERTDLLERDADGAYVAGPLFRHYASTHDTLADLARIAEPVLAAVSQDTGETVNLGVVRGDRVVHVSQVASRYLLGARDWTQVDVPSHASALGKVLYAHGVLPLPTGRLERVTERTLGTRAELARSLDRTRSLGYATTVDELEIGLSAVAVPVRGAGSEVLAALGISGPTQRLAGRLVQLGRLMNTHAEQLGSLLREQAGELDMGNRTTGNKAKAGVA